MLKIFVNVKFLVQVLEDKSSLLEALCLRSHFITCSQSAGNMETVDDNLPIYDKNGEQFEGMCFHSPYKDGRYGMCLYCWACSLQDMHNMCFFIDDDTIYCNYY